MILGSCLFLKIHLGIELGASLKIQKYITRWSQLDHMSQRQELTGATRRLRRCTTGEPPDRRLEEKRKKEKKKETSKSEGPGKFIKSLSDF